MPKTQRTIVIGVFQDRDKAQQAVNELRRMGFREEQIGVAARDGKSVTGGRKVEKTGTMAEEGAVVGLATGAGVGALWGLGIVAGVLPAIGPAIAGGALAAILSSAAAGAATATLAGALIGLGIPEQEASYYEEEFKAGRVIVTVHAGRRASDAREVLRRFGAYDIDSRQENRGTTGTKSQSRRVARARESAHRFKSRTKTPIKTQSRIVDTDTTDIIPVREEEIRVKKRPVKKGEVRIRKEVRVEPRTVEVPVTKEEVVIERRRGTGQPARSNIGANEEIRVPVREEQVHIEKRPVVKEEVRVRKRKVGGRKQVSATVRKEKVRVESSGNVAVRDDSGARGR